MRRVFQVAGAVVLAVAALSGCKREAFSEQEKTAVVALSLSQLPPLPPDPSNRYADEPLAAAFGATLFFEQRLSRNGEVACSTCHRIDSQFQDNLPRSVAIGTTDRRSMPLAGVSRSPFLFWDGRRDSLWAQAITPMEDAREHGGTRAAYAHFIAEELKGRYENIFGPLPDISNVPENASPLGTAEERRAWQAMTPGQQDGVNRVIANLGKAIEAFERTIRHEPTRFDRFADALRDGVKPAGDAALTDQEIYGLRLFIGRANCVTCHAGPRFTDDHFHNTGVPAADDVPDDLGRETGAREALADPFNCLGRYSDAKPDQCGELRFMAAKGPELRRAFKTPSLRGATSRPPYMHSGQIGAIEEVVDHYVRAPASPDAQTELVPLRLSDKEKAALIAFLKTLSNDP